MSERGLPIKTMGRLFVGGLSFPAAFHDFITEFYGSFSEKYFTCSLKKDIINKDLFRSEM